MAYFRLRTDARNWFRHIEHEFEFDFDMYYLCLIAGLAAGRKDDAKAEETTDLVENFPGDYKERGRMIVALFLSRELRLTGVGSGDRRALYGEISKLVAPTSPSYLSETGVREMNRYSSGGLTVLAEWFGEEGPQSLETFLILFRRRLAEALGAAESQDRFGAGVSG